MQNLKSSNQKSGKALVGLVFLAIGCILLLRTLDIFFVPRWVLSWPMFLIIIGLYVGSRQGYNRPSAFVPLGIGIVFLSNKIIPDLELSRFIWPLAIIGFGVWMILGRKSRKFDDFTSWNKNNSDPNSWSANPNDQPANDPANPNPNPGNTNTGYTSPADDKIESVSIFGGVKRNVVSKNFQGGEIVNFFGGTEINLMQADINGRVNLEVVQVFGGSKIIVPANWTVHSEMVAIFGGIEDKRPPQLNAASDKVLVIQGTSIFGGIDIKSF